MKHMGGVPKIRDTLKEGHRGYIGVTKGLGFPKIRGTIWGVPVIVITLFWGLYWGPPIHII